MKNNTNDGFDYGYIPLTEDEAENVLNRALMKIREDNKMNIKQKRKKPVIIFIAAALAVSGITAAAYNLTGADWFKGYYDKKAETPLDTYEDINQLDSMAGSNVPISISGDDITIELLGTVASEKTAKFSFLITNSAVDSIFIDDDKSPMSFRFLNAEGIGNYSSITEQITSEQDSSLADNQLILVYTINSKTELPAECTIIFGNYSYDDFKKTGDDIIVDLLVEEFRMTAPIPDTAESKTVTAAFNRNIYDAFSGKADITPFGIIINFSGNGTGEETIFANNLYSSEENGILFDDGEFFTFMSIMDPWFGTCLYAGSANGVYNASWDAEFATPIDITRIKSIIIDGIEIPVGTTSTSTEQASTSVTQPPQTTPNTVTTVVEQN